MIFVTVGTHEQQFNRLVKYMDELVRDGKVDDEVIIQTGYSDYTPMYTKYSKFFKYDEMQDLYRKARVIITHGGPSSFIPAIELGKMPIVVPRRKEYGEHVNNHQVEFCEKINNVYNNILLIEDIKNLQKIIEEYDGLNKDFNSRYISNNANFCENLVKLL